MADNIEIGRRIEARRQSLGLTLDDVAAVVGVVRSTIQRYEKGKIDKLKLPVLDAIAGALDVDPAWLCCKTDDMGSYDGNFSRNPRVPVLGSVPAGIPIEAIEDVVDWEEIPAVMLRGSKEYFGLRVTGSSMYPDFIEGDTVIIRKTSDFESGDVCVVYVNGYDATLKRVKIGEDGSWALIPRNPEYETKIFSAAEVKDVPVSIAGVVVELRRKVGG